MKPAFYAGSAYASWAIIFGGIYDLWDGDNPSDSRAEYSIRMEQVIEFLFFVILVWTAQRMLSHFIGSLDLILLFLHSEDADDEHCSICVSSDRVSRSYRERDESSSCN